MSALQNKLRRLATEWEKVFANKRDQQGISLQNRQTAHANHYQKKKKNPIKKWAKYLNRHFSKENISSVQFNHLVMSDSLATPWTAARQASLFITNSWNLLRLMPIKSMIPPNHLIICRPVLLPPSVFPSIRVFSNESALCIR